jgi:hypothetical protein
MKRRALLVAACIFAAVSLGLNVWLLVLRKDQPAAEAPPSRSGLPADVSVRPVIEPLTIDFSGTAFADDSWKLTDDPKPGIDLNTPFRWEESGPAAPDASAGLSRPADGLNAMHGIKVPFALPREPGPWRGELPAFPDLPLQDPGDARSRSLLVPPSPPNPRP